MAKANAISTDSVVLLRNSQGVEARGTLVRLTRQLAVFEVYNPYSIVQLSEVLQEVRIRRGERTIYRGRAVVSNLVPTGLMLIVSVALVDPWSDLAGLGPGEGLREEAERFVQDWQAAHQLDRDFQLSVSTLANFLQELHRWLEGTEVTVQAPAEANGDGTQREFCLEVNERIKPRLEDLFLDFEEKGRAIDAERAPVHKAFAQRILHPLTLVSPWIHRTYSKPLGYAGDYEMLNMVMRDPLEGHSAYAKILNTCILGHKPQQAYRNRIDMLTERLHHEAVRVGRDGRKLKALTVGCGPVNEIQRFLRTDELSDGCEFHMMDFNQPTIDYAASRVDEAMRDSGRRITPVYIHKSIHELLEEAKGRRASFEPTFDYVYCAGLFDYLSDRVCRRLIELFYQWVTPGGLVVVTNVENSDPILVPLEYLMEWHLIYRDESVMLRLAPGVGEQTVAVDATGVNMFLEVRKPEAYG